MCIAYAVLAVAAVPLTYALATSPYFVYAGASAALGLFAITGIIDQVEASKSVSFSSSLSGNNSNKASKAYKVSRAIHLFSLTLIGLGLSLGTGYMFFRPKAGAGPTLTEPPGVLDSTSSGAPASATSSAISLRRPQNATNAALLNRGAHHNTTTAGWAPPDVTASGGHTTQPYADLFHADSPAMQRTWIRPEDANGKANARHSHGHPYIPQLMGGLAGEAVDG